MASKNDWMAFWIACWHVSSLLQGEQLAEKLAVPRLRVHKDWFVGLAEDFIDHSHPDVGAAPNTDLPLNAQVLH